MFNNHLFSLAMVMRYAHLAPDYKLDAVERMATVFPGSRTDTKLAPEKNAERLETGLVQ
jgi:hypothetical protein